MSDSGQVGAGRDKSWVSVFVIFLRLGVTSFGGPVAHFGYFHDEFVKRRRWLDERAFADLMALCQFLPGPASSQMALAIGRERAGLAGGIAALVAFVLPSAVLMILAGYGIATLGLEGEPGWLHGLKLVAVAVVVQAVAAMMRSHARDAPRALIVFAAAIAVLVWREPVAQIAVIVAGGLIGLVLPAREAAGNAPVDGGDRRGRIFGAAALVVFAVLLIVLPLLAANTDAAVVDIADATYRSGALVFGGGHVVLPLLDQAVVTPGWIGANAFLAGYGLAQALPGPLFSFAAYLGTAMDYGPGGVAGGLLMLVMIYLPSVLLVLGALPFWERLRHGRLVRRALGGINAAVVGLLVAALYDPVLKTSIHAATDALLAFAALWALMYLRIPAWAVVMAGAGVGAGLAAF